MLSCRWSEMTPKSHFTEGFMVDAKCSLKKQNDHDGDVCFILVKYLIIVLWS